MWTVWASVLCAVIAIGAGISAHLHANDAVLYAKKARELSDSNAIERDKESD